MKKSLTLVLCVCMILMCFAGCGGSATDNGGGTASGETRTDPPPAGERELSGKTLRVGTMAIALGVPVQYAYEMGYFEEAGLDVEIIIFASGAPINEAMAAGELDMAVSGMASVYALSTGMYTYIGDGSITLEGEAIYARADSDIVTQGEHGAMIGSTETVEGVSILGPLATTAHFMSIKYVEAFGLTSNDFDMVSMEYAQAYQAFVMGEGDLLATIPPYTTQLEEEGYVQVCSVATAMGSALVNANYCQNDIYAERYEDLKVFLDCYYRACEELNADHDLRKEFSLRWYADNGVTYSDEDMESEIAGKIYHSFATLNSDEYPFGLTMTGIGEFFTTQGMIEEENLPNIAASMNSAIVDELKAERGL